APLATVAKATEAALASKHSPISWQAMMTGRKPEPLELRRFILTQPRLQYSAVEPGERASEAIHAAAQPYAGERRARANHRTGRALGRSILDLEQRSVVLHLAFGRAALPLADA